MATKKKQKSFDAVKMMHDIRKKISAKTQDMPFDELKKYIETRTHKGELHHSSSK